MARTAVATTKIWHPELSVILTKDIGEGCTVHAFVWIGEGVKIGRGCRIEPYAFIPEGVTIGNDVFIGPRVTFTNDRYPPSDRLAWERTWVKDRVSIGAGAIILPGLLIDHDARIGAGAVVTKRVEAYDVVYGNPASLANG